MRRDSLQKEIEKNTVAVSQAATVLTCATSMAPSAGPIMRAILNDIAEAVGMHESTISRVTTGSLIQTPRGTLELKAFFSVGVKQSNGNDSTSAASIRHRIKKLIECENPNAPVSDEFIVDTLSGDGIDVARRTVAKYRKLDNIPSSFARKRRNVISGVT